MKYQEAIQKINETKIFLMDFLKKDESNHKIKIKTNEKKHTFRSVALFIKSLIF